ncbi:class D sortase [Tumebacillus permanentifrigoris]|uniref:Sortase A n=1 Tax=Tumebacillus permanentifrigoris TaxID=378543 RepID=A0A316D526_9BACL|nr:class D sortase [Tumebacillus permanentifrigoris]PWK07912.1 sortase A [Tumebacillus permanentifrigoris]
MLKAVWQHSRAVPIILWLLLVVGSLMIAVPRIDEIMQEQKQNELLAGWTAQSRATTDAPLPHSAQERPNALWKDIDGIPVMGSITIAKVGLHEPLLKGADPLPLQVGIGVVEEDRLPGEPTNFVLAGHRSLKPGKHFNRLGELERGDLIEIESANGVFTYSVEASYLVDPDDLSVLDSRPGEADLTLITCHPMRNPTHRLIVKATLDQERGTQVATVEDKK